MEKEQVKKFDLEAAFKALDEIEIPVAEKGMRANRADLKEAFNKKTAYDVLVEDYYDISDNEALEEAQDDREGEVAKAKLSRIEKIVDLDAETADDLLQSYVGRYIIQCPQCMTLFYKKQEDIEYSEENPDVVNINEVCQHCGNTSGYTLIGKVDSVSDEEAGNYEIPEEENELDLDFDTEVAEEPTEEEPAEEEGSEDLDLDLDLDLEEIPEEEEEKKEESFQASGETVLNEEVETESLNTSEEAPSENETENGSEQLTLNEEGNAKWNALSDKPKGNIAKVKANPDIWEKTDKYIVYGVSADNKVVDKKEFKNESGKAADVKAVRDELLNSDEKIVDAFVARFYKNKETGEELEVELDSYTNSKNESLNNSEEAPSEHETENGSEETTLNEEVDKDLDAKLKAHNDYIAYLQGQIKQEEEALKRAGDNEEIKAAIQRRLDAYTQDLQDALPDALKNEPEANEVVVAEEPVEEVAVEEAPIEEAPIDEPVEEALTEETEQPKEKVALIDLSGSLAAKEQELVKKARDAGCKRMSKFTGPDFNKPLNFARNHEELDFIVYTNEDIEVNEGGKELQALSNVTVVRVDEANESLNASEAAPSENETENGSENLTLNEAVEDQKALFEAGEGDLDAVMDDPEFKKPISEKEVQAILNDSLDSLEEERIQPGDAPTPEAPKTYLPGEMPEKKIELGPDGRPITTKMPQPGDAPRPEFPKDPQPGEMPEKPLVNPNRLIAEDAEAEGSRFHTVQVGPKLDDLTPEEQEIFKSGDKEAIAKFWEDHPEYRESLEEDFDSYNKMMDEIKSKDSWKMSEIKDLENKYGCKIAPAELNKIPKLVKDLKEADEAEEAPAEEEPVEDVPAEEEPVEELQPIETTVEEVKEIATEVAQKLATPVNDEKEAEKQQEEIQEVVDEVVEEKLGEEKPEEGEAEEPVEDAPEFDFDDLQEESFNTHVKDFLTEVYENVADFAATSCELKEGRLIVEGKISFKSGKEKLTMFEFLPTYGEGKLFFEGYNKDFSADKAFTLNCSLTEAKEIITESFGYKYKINENLVEGLK